MQASWRKRRQILIISILAVIVLGFTLYKVYPYLNPPPNCFDKKQNGDERGIDCGGSCDLICQSDILPLDVKFNRFIESENNLYDFVAMINNKNSDKLPENGEMNYSFTAYDKAGQIVGVFNGKSPVLVGQSFPVILQNIPIDFKGTGNALSRIVFDTNANNTIWIKANEVFKENFFQIHSYDFVPFRNNVSQLSLKLENLTRAYFRDIPIRVLLLDTYGNTIAVNESLLKEINSKEIVELNFTWRVPLNIENPKIEVYPIINPNSHIK